MGLFLMCYFSIRRFARLIVLYPFCMIKIMRIKRTARDFSNTFVKAFNEGCVSIEKAKKEMLK